MRSVFLALAYVAIALALTLARPHSSPGPAMRDFEAYYCAGATLDSGGDPYSRAIWECERRIPGVDATHDELLPFVGPPPVLALFAPLARLPYDVARIVWYVTLLACAAILVLVPLLRVRPRESVPFMIACAAALCIGFGPLTSDLALGQIALLSAAGVALTCALPTSWSVVAYLAAALQPNVGLASVASLCTRTRTIAALIAAAIFFICGAIVAGASWPVAYARLLAAHAAAERGSVIQQTVSAIAASLGATSAATAALQILAALAAISFVILVWRASADTMTRIAAASLAVPFVATFFHEHDYCIALLPASIAAMRTTRPAIALVGASLVAVDWLGLAQRPEAALQSALLLLAFLVAMLALSQPKLREAIIAIAVVGVLFAGGAFLGAHHRITIWPDALGDYHAPVNASASEVWKQEQERSHQMQGSASDAAARAMPLIGCVLLGVALRYRRP